jgi:hypothetical protein
VLYTSLSKRMYYNNHSISKSIFGGRKLYLSYTNMYNRCHGMKVVVNTDTTHNGMNNTKVMEV